MPAARAFALVGSEAEEMQGNRRGFALAGRRGDGAGACARRRSEIQLL